MTVLIDMLGRRGGSTYGASRCPRFRRAALCVLTATLAISGPLGAQGLTFNKGQSVSPAFEGWERNPDGSFSLVFGYMNRNWEEQLDVPVGPDNTFSPGPADRGQPTHFLPRRNRFVFEVTVPADWGTKTFNQSITETSVNGFVPQAGEACMTLSHT